jgi:hypothetical protein
MASLLTAAQKASYEAVMQDMHDTFARTIYAYKEAQKVIVSTDPNFNYLYNNVKGVSQIVRKSQFQTLNARILYVDKNKEEMYNVDTQIKVERDIGEVRIKLDADGYAYFKDAKRVEIDGRLFYKITDVKKHGLFRPKFFTFYLRPTD